MVRKLKYHEQKLLKKVDFMNWKADNNLHEAKVLRKFEIRKREDYTKLVRQQRDNLYSEFSNVLFHLASNLSISSLIKNLIQFQIQQIGSKHSRFGEESE